METEKKEILLKNLESRLNQIAEEFNLEFEGREDEIMERLEPIAVSAKKMITIELSWGGGGDGQLGAEGFQVIYNWKTREIESVQYYGANWAWHEKIQLTENQIRTAEPFLRAYI